MKHNKIAIAMVAALSLSNISSADVIYKNIIHKNDYKYDKSKLLPSNSAVIEVTATNTTTNETETGNINNSIVNLSTENSHSIQIISDVYDNNVDGRSLIGEWKSTQPINFITNDKNTAAFIAPDFDGVYYVNLELDDGVYKKSYQSVKITSEFWSDAAPLYSEWQIDNVDQDWSPDLSLSYEDESITQTKIVDKSRTKQNQETRLSSGALRNNGAETIEYDLNISETRIELGTMEYWEATDPKVLVDWNVTQVFVDWTPDASGVYETETVSQYREIKKERTIQDQEIRPKTNALRTVGVSYKDTSLLNEYRDVQGQLEYWENTGTPTCTPWSLDRYDIWLPDASAFDRSAEVVQTRNMYENRECTGEQTRPATGATRSAEAEEEFRTTEETQTVYGSKIDLNDWYTNDVNGTWSVSNDGSYVEQSINGNSTVFESAADTYGNTVITGKMTVRAGAGDDDWIGMVVGKHDANNFLLWAWKRGPQGAALEGHTLANVSGGIGVVNGSMHLDKTGYEVLDTNYTDTNGWQHGIYYNFEITFTPTTIVIKVDGQETLSATGTFQTGKIGFYNLSQGQVEYYKVTDTPIK